MKFLRRLLLECFSALFLFVLPILFLPAASAYALSVNPLGDYDNIAVLEVLGDYAALDEESAVNLLPRQEVSKAFYGDHSDDYDFLVIFTNFDFLMPASGSKAFFHSTKNNIEGIGLDLFDATNLYSADGLFLNRLEGMIDMANVNGHELEPTSADFETTLQTLTHEMLHRWGAYLSFLDDGEVSDSLLGFGNAHWSFLFDSQGSSLYGNHWQDNGDGTYTSVAPEQSHQGSYLGRVFNPLELYLLGLYDRQQVPPLTLIDSPGIDRNRLPQVGVTIPGSTQTITMDQIVSAMGERFPAAVPDQAFRMAFLFLVNPGTWSAEDPSSMSQIRLIRNLQLEWEKRFSTLTGGTAILQTDLVKKDKSDSNPGVMVNAPNPHTSPHVNEGVNWLLTNQNQGGFWQDQAGTAQRDTATSVAALKGFPIGATSVANGQAWLDTSIPDNSDFLTRKLLGFNSSSLIELENLQNSDGGWGSAPGYRSNPVDSALALKALTANNSSNASAIDAAVSYLQAAGSDDGGWNFGHGQSMVQPTAYVLLALNDIRNDPTSIVGSMITSGVAWLSGKQNVDGGYGNSSSTVYDTAVSLSALRVVGVSQTSYDRAITYLLNNQGSTGSWNRSVFQTAMAVQALYAGTMQTDLQVEVVDLSVEPFPVVSMPADITFSAQIWNHGDAAVSFVKVVLYQGDPSLGVIAGEGQVSIAGHSFTNVDFPLHILSSGEVEFFVLVDPDDLVEEVSVSNNSASISFNAGVQPTVGFVHASSSGPESVADVLFEVSLSHTWDQSVSVAIGIAPASEALMGADYNLNLDSLVFNPGETSKTVAVNIVNDQLAESDEKLILILTSPVNATLSLDQTTYAIFNDDEPPVVGFSAISGRSPENVGTVRIDVGLSHAYPLDVMVDYAIDLTASVATPGEDVVPTSGSLTIPAGEISAAISMTIVNDTLEEADEVLVVRLSNPQQALLGSNTFAYTILDNDAAPQIEIISPTDNEMYASGQVFLQYQTNMSEEHIAVYLNGAAVPTRSGQPFVLQDNGTYTVRVVASNLNNASAEDSVSFVYDDSGTPPVMVWQRAGNISRDTDHARFNQLGYSEHDRIFVHGWLFDTKYQDFEQSFFGSVDQNNHLLKSYGFPGTWNSNTYVYDSVTTNDTYHTLDYLGPTQQYYIDRFNVLSGVQAVSLVVPHDPVMSESWRQFALDSTGGFYIAGSTREGISTKNADAPPHNKLIRVDSKGGQIWSQVYLTGTSDTLLDMLADEQDNVYLFGTTDGYLGQSSGGNAGGKDMYLVKVDKGGDTVWSRQWGTSADDEAKDIVFDSQGNLLLLGATSGTFDGLLPTNDKESILVKIDKYGNELWLKQERSVVYPTAITVAPRDEIVIAGASALDIHQLRWSAYSETGESIWSDMLANISHQYGSYVSDLLIDPKGNLFVTINADVGNWTSSSTVLRKYSSNFELHPPLLTVDPYSYDPVAASLTLSGSRTSGAVVSLQVDSSAAVGPVELSNATRWSCPLSLLQPGQHAMTLEAVGSSGLITTKEIVLDVVEPTPFALGGEVKYETVWDETATASVLTEQNQLYIVGQENPGDVSNQDVSVWQTVSGGILEKFVTFDTALLERGKAVAQAADGAVYIAWDSDESVFVAKHNADGSEVWSSDYSSRKGVQTVEDVAVDTEGNVYIAGYTTNSPDRNVAHGGGKDYFLVKFNSRGLYQWSRLTGLGHAEDQTAFGISIDSFGNIYIVGNSQEPVHGVDAANSPFIVKFDHQGTLLWVDVIRAPGPGVAKDVVADALDNVYVAGEVDLLHGEQQDGFIAKYSADGLQQWHETFFSLEKRDDFVTAIGLDQEGNVLATGYLQAIVNDPVVYGHSDGYWVKYDPFGRKQWHEKLTTYFVDQPVGIHGTSDGSVVVTGHTSNNSDADLDVSVREFNVSRLTPDLVLDQVDSTIASRSLHLSGQVSLGAQVSLTVDAPVNSTAIVGPVSLEPTSGLWSCLVTGLVPDAANVLTVVASDNYGSSNQSLLITVDTLSPGFSVDEAPLTTDLSRLSLSGTVERGAILTVEVNPPTSPVSVAESNGIWSYTANLVEGNNDLMFTATDGVGNAVVESVSITRLPPPPPSISVSPEMLQQGEPSDVILSISNPNGVGSSVYVTMLYDVADDGLSADDISVRKFHLYDGFLSSDPSVPGDEDGAVNGHLTTTLNFQYNYDVQKAPGHYIFKVAIDSNAQKAPFMITETSQAQTIHGYVFDEENSPIAGARVQLFDKWGQNYGYAYADVAGHYVFNVASPSEYVLIPTSRDHAYRKANIVVETLGAGQTLAVDLSMVTGVSYVGGWLKDSGTSEIITSGNYVRAENDHFLAEAYDLTHIITNTDNVFKYFMSVPAGDYALYVDSFNSRGAFAQGYLGAEGPVARTLPVPPELWLDKTTAMICGRVSDQEMMGVAGVVLSARPENGTDQFATAVTDVHGDYCLGLTDNGSWRISLNDKANQATGYVGNYLDGITATTGPFSENDLTVASIDSWVSGAILAEGLDPVAGVPVELFSEATGFMARGETADDGTYRLGAPAGNWSLKLFPEVFGYSSVNPVPVSMVSSLMVTQDFSVALQTEPLFVDVTLQSPTDQLSQMISGSCSENADVTVVVNTGAIIGPVVPLTSTTWECSISGLEPGLNLVSVLASNGVDTYQLPEVPIDYQPVQMVNSIAITDALYTSRKHTLAIDATSDYSNAALMVSYAGVIVPMNFEKLFKGKYLWSYTDTNVTLAPVGVTVSGVEGRVTADTTVK